MDWEQQQRAPTRAELDREAVEDWLAATYEARFAGFCREHRLDPEDPQSAVLYEIEWKEELDAGGDPRTHH